MGIGQIHVVLSNALSGLGGLNPRLLLMKKLIFSTLVLAALSGAVLVAQSDTPPPRKGGGPGGRRGMPPSPVMNVLDANHDGELSADEIANASKALLTLDKNGDGKLSADELRPVRPEGAPEGPPPGQ
jgi:hypothetical protein